MTPRGNESGNDPCRSLSCGGAPGRRGRRRRRPRAARSSTSSRCTSTPRRVSRRSAARSRGSAAPPGRAADRRVEQAAALQVGDVLAGAPGRSSRAARPRSGGHGQRHPVPAAHAGQERQLPPAQRLGQPRARGRPARRPGRGRRRPRPAGSPGAGPAARRRTGGPRRRPPPASSSAGGPRARPAGEEAVGAEPAGRRGAA